MDYRILLFCEDIARIVDISNTISRAKGRFEVIVAGNRDELLRIVDSRPQIDIVLVDLVKYNLSSSLPDLVIMLIESLQKSLPESCIVILKDKHVSPESIEALLDAGASDAICVTYIRIDWRNIFLKRIPMWLSMARNKALAVS